VSSKLTLPPSPLASFLERNASIPVLHLADHNGPINDLYAASRFDTLEGVDLERVCRASVVLARSLYTLASPLSGNSSAAVPPPAAGNLTVNCTEIAAVMNCLTRDFTCPYAAQFNLTLDQVPTHYVGVFQERAMNYYTSFLVQYMGLAPNSTTYIHTAVPRSVLYNAKTDHYEIKPAPGAEKEEIWAESNWGNDIGLRLYRYATRFLKSHLLFYNIRSEQQIISISIALLEAKNYLGTYFKIK
jgi:hypothetical protein